MSEITIINADNCSGVSIKDFQNPRYVWSSVCSHWLQMQIALSCERAINSFNTDMLVKCKSELGLWDTIPKGKGSFPRNHLDTVWWLEVHNPSWGRWRGQRGFCTNKSLPWRQTGTEMVNNSHSCAQTVWKGKSVQGCFLDKLVLLPKRLGFFLPWFHGCLLTFMPDWMRLGLDSWPLTFTFQLWRKEGCRGTRNGLKFASNELAAVLPTAELVFEQQYILWQGKGWEC